MLFAKIAVYTKTFCRLNSTKVRKQYTYNTIYSVLKNIFLKYAKINFDPIPTWKDTNYSPLLFKLYNVKT